MAEFFRTENPQLAEPIKKAEKGWPQKLWSDFERRTGDVLAEFFEDKEYPFSKRIGPVEEKFLNFLSSTAEEFLKFLLSKEAGWYVWAMRLYLKENNELADKFFDKSRKRVVGIAEKYTHDPNFEKQGPEKQAEFLRWFFAVYVKELADSTKGGKTNLDTQIRGIAWSLLAKDAKSSLKKFGQTVNGEWLLGVASPLILKHYEPENLEYELARFTRGDPQVIDLEPLHATI